MRSSQTFRLVLIVVLTGMIAAACSAAPTSTPAPSSPAPPAAKSRCGDGICDDVERSNPSLCPQDCAPAPAPTSPLPTQTARPPTATAVPPAAMSKPEGKCGDGVCDEAEQKDPKLCPQDCPAASPVLKTTVVPTVGLPTSTPRPTVMAPTAPTAKPTSVTDGTVQLASGEIARVGNPATIRQEGGGVAASRQANTAFILDASGSMMAALPGAGKTKLAVAKEVMAVIIPKVSSEVHGALWIYGHRYPQEPKSKSCQDIEKVFALGPIDATAYVAKVNAIQAIGYTPISDSIEQAAGELPPGDYNSIILVSDGEETCGGDPCAVAKALKASQAAVTIHVVGYAVEQIAQEQLQCIARASGGTYHDAQDAKGLLQALEEATGAAKTATILRVEVVGIAGEQIAANARLYERDANRMVAGWTAWVDNAAPPGIFDLVVDTLPKTIYQNLTLPEGSTTVVRITLGAISVTTAEGKASAADYFDTATNTRLVPYQIDYDG